MLSEIQKEWGKEYITSDMHTGMIMGSLLKLRQAEALNIDATLSLLQCQC